MCEKLKTQTEKANIKNNRATSINQAKHAEMKTTRR